MSLTSTASSSSLTEQVLKSFHSHVWTLSAYLQDALEPVDEVHEKVVASEDTQEYRDLLERALVTNADIGPRICTTTKSKLRLGDSCVQITELITRAQAKLFSKKRKPNNMITLGYRSADFAPEAGVIAQQGFACFFVNTVINAFQSSEWGLLHSRVGDAVILHLLTETSIFAPLPNDCYCQLTGAPLLYLSPVKGGVGLDFQSNKPVPNGSVRSGQKRKAPDDDTIERPRKRFRCKKEHQTEKLPHKPAAATQKMSAADIPLARISLFHARPSRQGKTGHILLGLQPNHVLNRMKSESWRLAKGLPAKVGSAQGSADDLRPGDRNEALEARHLSKYLFSLQYGLKNAFICSPHGLPDQLFERSAFMDREFEVDSMGASKTPDRLKKVLPLLAQLFRRHTKCGYKALLDKICPSKVKAGHQDNNADNSVILELISDEVEDLGLQTQIRNNSDKSNTTFSDLSALSQYNKGHGGSLSKLSQTKYKPKFAEFMCTHAEVFLYVRYITKTVIPFEFWGCQRNRKVILGHVKQFISGRRYEGMNLHNVMQGFSTSECDWLLPRGNRNSVHHLNQSMAEMLKRRELSEEFLLWYFDQFLVSLLKTTFYITESSAFRNRVLYFRQDDWDILCKPLIERLVTTTFKRIHQHEAEDLLSRRKLGYSFVRLLPKDSGVRPIVNLRRKRKQTSASNDSGQSINQILSGAFQILTYERSMQTEKLGASVFGPNEIFTKLKAFKQRIADSSGMLPKLYFVKMDVQACFDTVEQSKLLGILKSLISEDAYMIQRYGQIVPTVAKIKRTYMRKAMPESEHPDFVAYATRLAALLRHTILVDQVAYQYAFRDEIDQLLEDHITSNIVRIGQDYYRQVIGIPQGSVLSSLLCSFFYGDLERSTLRFVLESEKGTLLRLIDDYLYITTEEADARRFLQIMSKGHPEYGCFISKEKTLTSFDHHLSDLSQFGLSTVLHPDQKLFPWCGYLINMEDLSVMTDYSRFHANYLTDSLTVERSRHQNIAFLHKMLQLSKAKTHPVYTDCSLNSVHATRTNVHQAFVLTAMKMHAYLREAQRSTGVGRLLFVPRQNIIRRKPSLGTGKPKNHLMDIIQQCIHYTFLSIRNMANGKIAKEARAQCALTRDEVSWLGMHAFHAVFSRKRTAYARAGVLQALTKELALPRHRGMKRHLSRLAKESLRIMLENIEF